MIQAPWQSAFTVAWLPECPSFGLSGAAEDTQPSLAVWDYTESDLKENAWTKASLPYVGSSARTSTLMISLYQQQIAVARVGGYELSSLAGLRSSQAVTERNADSRPDLRHLRHGVLPGPLGQAPRDQQIAISQCEHPRFPSTLRAKEEAPRLAKRDQHHYRALDLLVNVIGVPSDAVLAVPVEIESDGVEDDLHMVGTGPRAWFQSRPA